MARRARVLAGFLREPHSCFPARSAFLRPKSRTSVRIRLPVGGLILVLNTRPRHNRPPDHFDDLRDDRVAEAPQSVHPSGNPMSHSTHVGFSCPVLPGSITTPFKLPCDTSCVCDLLPNIPDPLWHTAVGVGHITAATASTKLPLRPFRLNRSAISGVGVDPMQASAVGVG